MKHNQGLHSSYSSSFKASITVGLFIYYGGGVGTKKHKRKLKDFNPIKWRPLSIFFIRSVAFDVDIIPLSKIFITAVSDLVNTQSHPQNEV